MNFLKNARALIVAGLGLAAIATAALALNVGSNPTWSARDTGRQEMHYQRVTVNWNDPSISSGVKFGRLPSYAFISSIKAHVETAFNAGTTNVVTVGSNGTTYADIFRASDLNEASATYQNLTSAPGLGINATSGGEADLYAIFTQTGTAATAGKVHIVIEYEPNNDH